MCPAPLTLLTDRQRIVCPFPSWKVFRQSSWVYKLPGWTEPSKRDQGRTGGEVPSLPGLPSLPPRDPFHHHMRRLPWGRLFIFTSVYQNQYTSHQSVSGSRPFSDRRSLFVPHVVCLPYYIYYMSFQSFSFSSQSGRLTPGRET